MDMELSLNVTAPFLKGDDRMPFRLSIHKFVHFLYSEYKENEGCGCYNYDINIIFEGMCMLWEVY